MNRCDISTLYIVVLKCTSVCRLSMVTKHRYVCYCNCRRCTIEISYGYNLFVLRLR